MKTEHPETPTPRVFAAIVDGPLTREAEQDALGPRDHTPTPGTSSRISTSTRHTDRGLVGACIRFDGIVRKAEPCADDEPVLRDLIALHYQTYDPMAEQVLLALSHDVAQRHGLISLTALHSRGRVPVGSVSFVLIVESAHRAESLRAIGEFIDRMKQDAPIWKHPVWA